MHYAYVDSNFKIQGSSQHQSLVNMYLHMRSSVSSIKISKKTILIGSYFHIPLMETERDIFDLIWSLKFIELHHHVLLNQVDSQVCVAVVKSSILAAIFPQTYVFPEFVY